MRCLVEILGFLVQVTLSIFVDRRKQCKHTPIRSANAMGYLLKGRCQKGRIPFF